MELPPSKVRAQEEIFECPAWAGMPRPGVRFDVIKQGRLVEILMVDAQPYYLFGRSKGQCDFTLENPSVSRIHFALVHHRNGSVFIIDLGSNQGTSVNGIRCGKGTTKILPGQSLKVGNSTRLYELHDSQSLRIDPAAPVIHGKWDQKKLSGGHRGSRNKRKAGSDSEEYDPEQALIDDADDIKGRKKGLGKLGRYGPTDNNHLNGDREKNWEVNDRPLEKFTRKVKQEQVGMSLWDKDRRGSPPRGTAKTSKGKGKLAHEAPDDDDDDDDDVDRRKHRPQKRYKAEDEKPVPPSDLDSDGSLYADLKLPPKQKASKHHRGEKKGRKDKHQAAQESEDDASGDKAYQRKKREAGQQSKVKGSKKEKHRLQYDSDSSVEQAKPKRKKLRPVEEEEDEEYSPGPKVRKAEKSRHKEKVHPVGRPSKATKHAVPKEPSVATSDQDDDEYDDEALRELGLKDDQRSPSPAQEDESPDREAMKKMQEEKAAKEAAAKKAAAAAKEAEAAKEEKVREEKELQKKLLQDMMNAEKELAQVMANYYTNFPEQKVSGTGQPAKPLVWQCRICHVEVFRHRQDLYEHLRSEAHQEWWTIQKEQRKAQGLIGGLLHQCVVCDAKVPESLLELHLKQVHKLDIQEIADVTRCYLSTKENEVGTALSSAVLVKQPKVVSEEQRKAEILQTLKKKQEEKVKKKLSQEEEAKKEEKWRAFKWLSFAKAYCHPLFKSQCLSKEKFKEIVSEAMRRPFDSDPSSMINAVNLKNVLDELCSPHNPQEADKLKQMEAFKQELAAISSS